MVILYYGFKNPWSTYNIFNWWNSWNKINIIFKSWRKTRLKSIQAPLSEILTELFSNKTVTIITDYCCIFLKHIFLLKLLWPISIIASADLFKIGFDRKISSTNSIRLFIFKVRISRNWHLISKAEFWLHQRNMLVQNTHQKIFMLWVKLVLRIKNVLKKNELTNQKTTKDTDPKTTVPLCHHNHLQENILPEPIRCWHFQISNCGWVQSCWLVLLLPYYSFTESDCSNQKQKINASFKNHPSKEMIQIEDLH